MVARDFSPWLTRLSWNGARQGARNVIRELRPPCRAVGQLQREYQGLNALVVLHISFSVLVDWFGLMGSWMGPR